MPAFSWNRYSWNRYYEKAMLETDRARLSDRISAAEEAIQVRMAEIWESEGEHVDERDAIENALKMLRALRREAA